MNQSNFWWLLVVFVVVSAVAAPYVKAETNLYAGAWSTHIGTDEDYNSTHNLLAVEHEQVFAGYFRNSYDEDAFAAGYRFQKSWGDFEGGLLVGATYGYRDCLKGYADADRRLCPAVAPMVSYTRYRVQPTVILLGNAVAVSVRFEL